ncbi:MAG: hypothetical protein GAK39_06412 [Variovorax sp.]|nr:MAG: hypothetical protein GAK39_06412 [Variovorax sp.]
MRALVDEAEAHQRAGPGDTAVGGVEDADLGFLVGLHRVDQFDTHARPVGAAGREVVLDDPLDEALAGDRGRVVATGGGLHARAQLGRRARRDAVDHGIGAARVRLRPGQQLGIARALDELEQAGAEALAVVAQVVAVQQRERPCVGGLARAQDRADGTVDGHALAACFTLGGTRDVGHQVGEGQVEPALGVEVVAGLGDGEGDDARGRRGAARDRAGERGLVGQHLADGLDLLVAVLARGRDGLERVAAALGAQRLDDLGHVGPDVGARDRPARVARVDQPLQVDRLVRPVEGPEAEVEHRELRGSGWKGRCCESHEECPGRGMKREKGFRPRPRARRA